jgi:LPXTG-motif cell wall-anchored protein
MLRMNSSWKTFAKLMAPVLLFGLLSWYNPGLLILTGGGLLPNEYKFKVDTTKLVAGKLPTAHYRLFMFHGDGTYSFDTMTAQSPIAAKSVRHRYNRAGTYRAYGEATLMYDDKNPPPMALATPGNVTVTPAQVTSTSSDGSAGSNKPLTITPTRELVPSHKVTFILRLQPIGEAQVCINRVTAEGFLLFDSTVLKYDSISLFPDHKTTIVRVNRDTVFVRSIEMTPTVSRNVFLNFTTRSTASVGQTLRFPPSSLVAYKGESAQCNSGPFFDTLKTYTRVKNGHDPNLKSITPSEVSLDFAGNYVFDIDFQNEGYGPTNRVTITDELDFFIRRDCPELLNSNLVQSLQMTAYPGAIESATMSAGGRLVVKINNTQLEGTKQTGFLNSHFDPDTRGHLRFVIPANSACTRWPRPRCGALVNQAEIEFEYNPIVRTPPAFSRFLCQDSTPTLPCSGCIETILQAPDVTTVGQVMIPTGGIPGFNPADYNNFKWYPSDGLSAYSVYNPMYQRKLVQNYTLVATKNAPDYCKRAIVHVAARPTCNLGLNITKTPSDSNATGTCEKDKLYDVTATVSLPPGQATNLVWQDGSAGVRSFSKTNFMGDYLYISVKDTETKCSEEVWFKVKPDPMVVSDISTDCVANLAVTGGAAPYTFAWGWQGGNAPASSSPTFDLFGKNNPRVTVTDDSGCTTVFWPTVQNCGSTSSSGLLVGAGVLLLGAGAYFFQKRKK